MKTISPWLFAILFAFLTIEIVLLYPRKVNFEDSPFREKVQEEKDVQQAMKGVHLVEANKKEKEWELWAEEALSLRSKQSWELKGVKVRFFSPKGVEFLVRGQRGTVELRTKNMRIKGDVTVQSSNGYVFYTEEVEYISSYRLLKSLSPVQLKDHLGKRRMFLRGQQMRTGLKEAITEIEGDIYASRLVEGKGEVKVKSDRVILRGNSREIQFLDNVVVDYTNMRISGASVKFIFSKKGELKTLLISGGVRLTDKEKWAVAQKLSFTFSKDRLILSGNPKLIQGEDELIGDTIIFNRNGEQVEVLKAKARVGKEKLKAQEEGGR
ncbi:MAG: LPS export ABC transporter periplasmic protein LptC [Bdellovibrio sp.]|nr:MAG: LPS export ABC transporter periplasmic protein LptC [Bdellovibrio sp.]